MEGIETLSNNFLRYISEEANENLLLPCGVCIVIFVNLMSF